MSVHLASVLCHVLNTIDKNPHLNSAPPSGVRDEPVNLPPVRHRAADERGGSRIHAYMCHMCIYLMILIILILISIIIRTVLITITMITILYVFGISVIVIVMCVIIIIIIRMNRCARRVCNT